MNRYPWWKYAILAVALVVGVLYTLPNFFGEAPAVQVSSAKVTVKVEAPLAARVEQILTDAGIQPDFVQFEGGYATQFSRPPGQLQLVSICTGTREGARDAQIRIKNCHRKKSGETTDTLRGDISVHPHGPVHHGLCG